MTFILSCGPPFMSDQPRSHKAPVRHTLQPLCDLSATDNFHRSQGSQQGCRSVPARLQRSRRLVGDLAATKSVAARFLNMHKSLAATDLVADRSRRSRRPVPDQSPTSRRLVADRSPTNFVGIGAWLSLKLVGDRSPTNFVRIGTWLSLKLVGDRSATGRRLIGDLTATSLQLLGDLSAICSKIYSISLFHINNSFNHYIINIKKY